MTQSSSASLLKKLVGQTAIYGLSSIIGRLLNYLLVPLYTRYFLPAEYGVVTELYGYVGFLMVIFTYGMETAFFRYVKDAKEPANVYSTAIWSLFSSSALLVGLFLLFSPFIADTIQYSEHIEYVIWFALVLGFDAMAAIPFANLRYEERPVRFALVKFANIGINIGLNLFFIVLCPQIVDNVPLINNIYDPSVGVGYIFISNLVASAVTLLLLLPELRSIRWSFDVDLWKKMMRYALPLVVVGFAGTINEMLDRVLLKYLLPYDLEGNLAQVGIYGACYKLSILMTLFTQAFRYAAEPFFFSQSKQENAANTYAMVMKYFVLVGGFIFLGVTIFLDVFKYFIGERYHEGLVVVPILLMANLFLGIYYNLSIWYKLTNNTLIGAFMALAGATITIVLNILLIPVIGYIGSAWATLICYITMVGLSYLLSKRYYPIPYDLHLIARYLLLAVLLFLIDNQLIGRLLDDSLVLGYLGKIVLIIVYIVALVYQERKNGLLKR